MGEARTNRSNRTREHLQRSHAQRAADGFAGEEATGGSADYPANDRAEAKRRIEKGIGALGRIYVATTVVRGFRAPLAPARAR